MKMNLILEAIRTLSHSQGFYGRLYRSIMELKKHDADAYDEFVEQLEAQEFEDVLDVVLYFER